MKVKENLTKEDILNIEKYIELVTKKNYCECNELNEICSGSQCYGSRNVAYSMKRILSDYKRVLKENEELKETLKCTQNSWYEDTQKIEEMKKQIDLDNECEIALNSKVMDLENADKKWEDRIKAINERILELQELIEREK